MILDKSFNLFKPQFPNLKNKDKQNILPIGFAASSNWE